MFYNYHKMAFSITLQKTHSPKELIEEVKREVYKKQRLQ